jgi:hypothetical protein
MKQLLSRGAAAYSLSKTRKSSPSLLSAIIFLARAACCMLTVCVLSSFVNVQGHGIER